MARRQRIQHPPAADRRRRPQHDAVAARGHDRRAQPQLRVRLSGARDAGDDLARPVVQLDARRDLRERLERDVEAIAGAEGAARHERVPAAQLRPLDSRAARPRRAGPPPRARPARRAPRRCGLGRRGQRARRGARRPPPIEPDHSVPVATVPMPRSVKTRSTYRRAGPLARPRSPAASRQRRLQLVQAGTGLRAHRHHGRAGHELACLFDRELERLLVDRVRLRHRDDAAVDPEQAQDRQMLVRLRPRALGRVDHEQEEVDPARPRDHVVDEALVTRDVDDGQPPPVREVERRVAEVDRDPARLLLG